MLTANSQNLDCPQCRLVCRWGGEVVEEPGGVNYRGGELCVILASKKMSFSEIIGKIYERTGFDQTSMDLKLQMQFPTTGSYTAVPLVDDNSLNTMWTCVAQLSRPFMELYIEQIPVNTRTLVAQDIPAINQGDPNSSSVKTGNDVPNGTSHANSLMSSSRKLQDELEKTGSKMKQHEDNLKFLKAQKNQLDDAILDFQVNLGNCLSSSAPTTEDDNSSHVQSEEETVEQILKHEKSAAGIFCQLKSRHGLELSNLPFSQDVLGVVATLGKVDDDNLNRLFSEYLGLQTMLAIVCKTFEGVKALEMYDGEGIVKKVSGIHGLGASVGRVLQGRFLVICLDNLRPYAGEILADDPDRRLDIPKPRLPTGDIPAGFLGFAVNMINVDRTHVFCLTSGGCGLRETLFFNLFSRLQVYRTRAEMLVALPCISDGAISIDGGMIRANGVFSLGSREDVDVRFPKCSMRSKLPDKYHELENQMKQKKWERERILEDVRREQALLDQEKFNFQLRKQDFLKFLADSSSYVTQQQMQTAARNRMSQP